MTLIRLRKRAGIKSGVEWSEGRLRCRGPGGWFFASPTWFPASKRAVREERGVRCGRYRRCDPFEFELDLRKMNARTSDRRMDWPQHNTVLYPHRGGGRHDAMQHGCTATGSPTAQPPLKCVSTGSWFWIIYTEMETKRQNARRQVQYLYPRSCVDIFASKMGPLIEYKKAGCRFSCISFSSQKTRKIIYR